MKPETGDHYFVQDGHHRVSVLKNMGVPCTEAYVTEVYIPRDETRKD